MAVLLATPVVLVNLFLLLGDRKINVTFYTQLDTPYVLAALDFIGWEVLDSLQFYRTLIINVGKIHNVVSKMFHREIKVTLVRVC